MKLWRLYHNLRWIYKKHIAIGLCIGIILFGIVISISHTRGGEVSTAAIVTDRTATGSSISLDLNSSMITREIMSDTDISQRVIGQKRELIDNVRSNMQSDEGRVKDQLTEARYNLEQIPYEVKNYGTDSEVTNLKLYSYASADHGTVPSLTTYSWIMQYPVELGYPVDQNYDGKLVEPDEDLMNMTFGELEDSTEEEKELSEETDSSKERMQAAGEDTGSAEEVQQNVAGEMKAPDQEEKIRLKNFRDNIYYQTQSTDPIFVEQYLDAGEVVVETVADDLLMSEDNEEELSDETDTSEEIFETDDSDQFEAETDTDSETDQSPVEVVTLDAGDFLVQGFMREGSDVFVGDVQIFPSGENGFNKVRLGSDGEFLDSVTIKEDTALTDVELYFSDGEEITSVTFSYAKDTEAPSIVSTDKVYKTLTTSNGSIYCLNSSEIGFIIEDGDKSAGIDKATLVYGDRFGFMIDGFETPCYELPENFYGRVLYGCTDQAGNTSETEQQYYLIERNAPTIQVDESEIYTAPYTMGIHVADTGSILSGIDVVECTVNGETYEPEDAAVTEFVKLADDLEIPSKEVFFINFPETGHYDVSIRVSDNCGNAVVFHKTIDVTEAELVSVYLAEEFRLYIDPDQLFGKGQIFSEGLTLKNVSNVDVKVTVKEISIDVKSETTGNGIEKDCTLYMIAPDTGEKIPLHEGVNTDVYSYQLPQDAAQELSGISFVGQISEGSDMLWKEGDISLNIKFSFDKWEE